jgi:hypothetical protein
MKIRETLDRFGKVDIDPLAKQEGCAAVWKFIRYAGW